MKLVFIILLLSVGVVFSNGEFFGTGRFNNWINQLESRPLTSDSNPNPNSDDRIAALEKSILKLRQSQKILSIKFQQTTDQLQSILAVNLAELDILKKNPVPMGFIYTQYPNQPSPSELWPHLGWTDLTSSYAGLFFRAEGGNSLEFGSGKIPIQNDSTRQITQIQYREMTWGEYPKLLSLNSKAHEKSEENDGNESESDSGWSEWVKSGFNYWDGRMGREEGLRFYTEENEVRPVNTAIKIWKRSA